MTREKQIELMRECVEDADKVLNSIQVSGMSLKSRLAIAFFQYRVTRSPVDSFMEQAGIMSAADAKKATGIDDN